MRQLQRCSLALAVALAVAGSAAAAFADPGAPQISPLHRQREDAQRLTEQQRGLESPPPAAQPAAQSAPAPAPTPRRRSLRGVGFALLGLAGLSAAIGLPLLVADRTLPGQSESMYGTATKALLATGLIAGLGGVVLLSIDSSVRVSPVVSSSGAGIAIMGRM